MTELKKIRWFWAWDDEKEEAWLQEMARQGWRLKSGGLLYTFESGEPRDIAYRLDFFTDYKNKENYLQIFRDAGWEYVGAFGSWQYFRKPVVSGEPPEIFTDNESKVKKYQRVMMILVIFMPIYVSMINNVKRQDGVFFEIVTFIFFLIIIFFCFAILKLMRRISQLKRL